MTFRREHHYDPSTGMHVERVIADVEPILEENLALRNQGANGFTRERTMRKIGSIPMLLLNEALKEGLNPLDGSKETQRWIRKTLEENPKFRTVDAIDSGKSRRGLIIK